LDIISPPANIVSNVNDATTMSRRSDEDTSFPLLFQGSKFIGTTPLIHDIDGDGINDAILVDYDGMVTLVALDLSSSTTNNHLTRYMKELRVPNLVVREDWVKLTLNDTARQTYYTDVVGGVDIYHSYFDSPPSFSYTNTHDATTINNQQSTINNRMQ